MTTPEENTHQKANHLAQETSPYLLQHAYNPVAWYPWGKEALEKAKKEDKPILISIGYSTCHWCHVMERESFENDSIATLMNENFICIKIDREERPDIDQIYMEAVQMMGLQGGWPLNVFLTPDQKPFYGGTYFPPARWRQVLTQLSDAYQNQKEEVISSSNNFVKSLAVTEASRYGLSKQNLTTSIKEVDKIFPLLERRFDTEYGGMDKEPKFPMPSIYRYLLYYYDLSGNESALKHVTTTLTMMCQGGIYDQIGGGFARYSTDKEWLAPHFEKMLYDNGQLVSLYAEAYQVTKKELFKDIVYETLAFVEREMMSKEYAFYSALDADSEGEEGKYYVWEYDELEKILGNEFELFAKYFDVSPSGNWEGSNIIRTLKSKEQFCKDENIVLDTFNKKLHAWKALVLKEREQRIIPSLDDKALTSWNALMLKGYIDAYKAFGDEHFLQVALKNATFIKNKLLNKTQLLRTYKNGHAKIEAFLEDYALVIDAFSQLYQISFDEDWVLLAKKLTEHSIEHFFDEKEQLFFFSSQHNEQLIVDKKELFDNVIPASNSIMATNLFFLGTLFDEVSYTQKAENMLSVIKPLLFKEPSYVANWASLYAYKLSPTAEIVIAGKNENELKKLQHHYLPNSIKLKSSSNDWLPLIKGKKSINNKITFYTCFDKTCQLPVHMSEDVINLIKGRNISKKTHVKDSNH